MTRTPIPVILDTDIGGDIDDTWALAFLLRCPELDLKLAVADTGDTQYRARLLARLLETDGRADVPVGIGRPTDTHRTCRQGQWVQNYDLKDYPGTVHEDGVGAMIETILQSPVPVTLVCIGPVPNIAEALEREPRIARNARFVGMHGCIRRSQRGDGAVYPECNVVHGIAACRAAFEADWEVTVTPLDTCGFVTLEGEHYRTVKTSEDPLLKALMENYRIWARNQKMPHLPEHRSSILFDTVAVYLAFREDLLEMEELPVRVTDDGLTVVEPGAPRTRSGNSLYTG